TLRDTRAPIAPASVAVIVRLWPRRRRLLTSLVSFSVAPLAVSVCFLQTGQLTVTFTPGRRPLTTIRPSVTALSETLQLPVTPRLRRTGTVCVLSGVTIVGAGAGAGVGVGDGGGSEIVSPGLAWTVLPAAFDAVTAQAYEPAANGV